MSTGKTLLALALSALLPAGAAWAANNDTLRSLPRVLQPANRQLWPVFCGQLSGAV